MRATLGRRVGRLDAERIRTAVLADAQRLAADLGISVAALLADAVELAGWCRAAGASRRAEIVALAAAEQRREAAEVGADLEAAMTRWGG